MVYSGSTGRIPRYVCQGGRTHRGNEACLALGGGRIERAVYEQVLAAIQPAGIQAALAALDQAQEAHEEKRRSLELALEKARYEAGRARRQYDAVDPENRLVAGELESRWNDALRRVSTLETELDTLDKQPRVLSEEQRRRLLELGNDLPTLWEHPAAPAELKKRILRAVLEEILIDDDNERSEHILRLHWKGGVHTEIHIRRNTSGRRRQTTEQQAIDLIRELSKVCSDQTIAATLNRLGCRTGAGETWRVHSVQNARYYYRLPNHRTSKQWFTVQEASQEMKVSATVIRRLIKTKVLPAEQVVPLTPWIIARQDLSLPAVQAEVEAVRQGRQLQHNDATQDELSFESTTH